MNIAPDLMFLFGFICGGAVAIAVWAFTE